MNITNETQTACPLCGCNCDAQAATLHTNNDATSHIAAFLKEARRWKRDEPFYWLATTEEISDTNYRADLKRAIAQENIGERDWLTACADTLLKVDMNYGRIWRPMEPYPIPFVDDVIPNDRYMRDFMRSETCEFPERDKLLDLNFRVNAPEIASSFGR